MKSIIVFFTLLAATIALSVVEDSNAEVNFFSIENRIAGGEYAEVGQFPHQIGVQTHRLSEEGWDYTSFCGGSLISIEFVLTAAHCLHGGVSAEVFLGATNFTGSWYRMEIKKENMIIHEKYDPVKIRDDLGLIRLPQKAPISALVQTINLPRISERNTNFEKNIGWILGWGRMGDTGNKAAASSHLRYARRWILPDTYCAYNYPSYEKNTQMCVDGSHGISACPGDSGGPVYIEDKYGSRTLLGVASYERYEGCEKDFPVVYSRVTQYLDWIVEKTGITLRD